MPDTSLPPLRIGILGAANIAPMAMIKPARSVPGAEVTAVAARDPEKARRFAARARIPKVHGSYEALLDDPDIDAVYNPLPNGLHGVWTVRALRAGKHVLCEKPFTANAEEAREVAQIAAGIDRVLMEAFHWRYHPLADRMVEIVQSGELGEIRHVEAALCAPILKRSDIRYNLSLAGGATMDMGCYTLHIVRTLAGAEPRVRSARATISTPGVDRAMEAALTFDDGRTGRIVCSLFSRRLISVYAKVVGSRGTMRALNPIAPQFFHRLRIRTDKGSRSEKFPGATSYGKQLEAFVRAVRDGAPILTDTRNAITNMELIDAVYRAAGMQPRQPTPG
jgi:predicted dehydrogenase